MLTHLVAESDSGPVILWGMTLHRKDELEHMKQTLAECGCEMPYTLIAFQVSDWNRNFHPGNRSLGCFLFRRWRGHIA